MGIEQIVKKFNHIASNEGIKVLGTEYVSFRPREPTLPEPVLASINRCIFPYDFDPILKPSELSLGEGWQATSYGGDECKLIAINKELGIAIKRYMKNSFAWMVFHGCSVLAETVDTEKHHLLMPIVRYGDTLIFPYLEIQDNPKDVDDPEVREILTLAEHPPLHTYQHLTLAYKFKKLVMKDGESYYYSDFFDDSKPSIEWDMEDLERLPDFG